MFLTSHIYFGYLVKNHDIILFEKGNNMIYNL